MAKKFFAEWREGDEGVEAASAGGAPDEESRVAGANQFVTRMVSEPGPTRLIHEWPADVPPPKVGERSKSGGVVEAVYERLSEEVAMAEENREGSAAVTIEVVTGLSVSGGQLRIERAEITLPIEAKVRPLEPDRVDLPKSQPSAFS